MTDSKPTSNELRAALSQLRDPEIGRTLGELRMLPEVDVAADGTVHVTLDLPTPAYPEPERLEEAIREAVIGECGEAASLDVKTISNVRGMESGGTLGLKVKNVIAVGSGKGGVGKSTIAASLAFGLKEFGARVGLMDADVYGPSIPHLVGAKGQPAAIERPGPNGETITRLEPINAHGVKCISIGFFIEADKAVVWRGPLLHRAITQFLKDTEWGELDYLVIDLPPGTGDVSLTLSQLLGLAGAVVVCTPQEVALLDAVKAISMYRQVKIPVLGIVENMSGDIFGRGGAKAKAEQMGIPFLGEVPMEVGVRVQGDAGRIHELFAEDSPSREPLLNVTRNVAMGIARQLLETPRMPTLEVL